MRPLTFVIGAYILCFAALAASSLLWPTVTPPKQVTSTPVTVAPLPMTQPAEPQEPQEGPQEAQEPTLAPPEGQNSSLAPKPVPAAPGVVIEVPVEVEIKPAQPTRQPGCRRCYRRRWFGW